MDEEIRLMLEKNLRISEEIKEATAYIKDYIRWQKIMFFVKLVVILAPIIAGYIIITPLLKTILNQYSSLLNSEGGTIEKVLP